MDVGDTHSEFGVKLEARQSYRNFKREGVCFRFLPTPFLLLSRLAVGCHGTECDSRDLRQTTYMVQHVNGQERSW